MARPSGWLLAVLAGALLGVGCATGQAEKAQPQALPAAVDRPAAEEEPPSFDDENFVPYWVARAQDTRARRPADVRPPIAPAAAVSDDTGETYSSYTITQPEPELPSKKVSLVMRDAQVADVLQALARAADVNILVSPDIEGITTVELRDVPWNEAFGGLLANLGLHHKWMGSILRVMTPDGLQKEVDIEKIEKERQVLRHERRQVEALVLQTIPIHYANAVKLQPILEDLLTGMDNYASPSPEVRSLQQRRGSVTVDEENNALVINALRDDILKMIEVVSVLDQPKDQVLIEAKIIVANRETARELGFQWGGLYQGGRSAIYPGSSSSSVLGKGVDTAMAPISGNFSNFPSNTFSTSPSTTDTGTGTGTGTTTGTTDAAVVGATGLSLGYAYQNLGDYILTAQLTALESAGKAQIIASPSITALDNEKATLKSGFEIPYQTTSDNEGTETAFKEALLELTVTPHIIDGRMVKLKVLASNDEPDYSRVDSGITSEPAISRRTAETSLLLFDGETTVIGGLSRTYGNDSTSGVPWLKDLPGIGRLFRTDTREKREEEMLIFITPHILGGRAGSPAGAATPAPTPGPAPATPAEPAPQPAPETTTP